MSLYIPSLCIFSFSDGATTTANYILSIRVLLLERPNTTVFFFFESGRYTSFLFFNGALKFICDLVESA